MNLSEIFIRRPIATSLVMLGIAVFGIVAYRALPVSDLPERRLPDAQRQRGSAGRRSGHDGFRGGESPRAPVHHDRRPRRDDLVQPDRRLERHAAVRSRPQHRQRRGRRPDGHRGRDAPAAGRHAGAAVVPEVQPGRPADHVSRADLGHAADVRARRLRRNDDRAADFDGQRRVAGAGAGRAEVRGPRAGGSRRSCRRRRSA